MLLTCNNKGCLKSSDALLNIETQEVICSECGKAISNIAESMKRALKSFGQIVRNQDKRAFMMGCKNCNANREVVLDDKNNTICKVCTSDIKVQPAMKQAMISIGQKLNKPEEDDIVDEKPTKEKKQNPAMNEIFFDKLAVGCHNLLFDDKKTHSYLLSRGMDAEIIKSYKLGAFPKDLRKLYDFVDPKELREYNIIWAADKSPFKNFPIVIPIRNTFGKTVAIGCRTLMSDDEREKLGIPKYRNSVYQKSSHLFGLDRASDAIKKNNTVFVVEGYFDVLSAHQRGHLNVVATCGTAFSLRQLSILARYTDNIVLLFDNDNAGKLNSKRVFNKFIGINTGVNLKCSFTPDGFKDLDEFLFKGENFENLRRQ